MAVPDGFAVDVPLLRKIAHNVAEVARTVDGAVAPRRDTLTFAATADAGWSAAEALRSGTAAWETFLSGLHTRLSGLGSQLSTAADGYEQADADAARRHRSRGD
jgi:Excreted virulence factor EspC, type VII ESX diderm